MSDWLLKVRVPATSANLGSGFDTLGMAVSLYNIFVVEEKLPTGEFRSDVIGEGATELTEVKTNMVIDSYLYACREWGVKDPCGFALRSHNVIPLARGLGSSAGAVVSGVLIANELNGVGASEDQLLKTMTQIEGHPDNVAPCYLGGMTVCTWDGEKLSHVRLPELPRHTHVVVAVPNVKVSTESAREALPDKVDFRDAVFNVSRAALFTAAWATGKWELLSSGMDDRLHQQYRTKLFPGGDDVISGVRDLECCMGVAVSGSGPSIIALVRSRPRQVAETMCRIFADHGVESQFFVLSGCADGVSIERSTEAR